MTSPNPQEGGKHTSGPWSFEATCFDRRIPIRGGVTAYGRPYTIAWVNRPGSAIAGEDKANARLIAAAPALLEAVADFCRVYEGFQDGDGNPCPQVARGLAALRLATEPTSER